MVVVVFPNHAYIAQRDFRDVCVRNCYHITIHGNAGCVLRDFILCHSVFDFVAVLVMVEVFEYDRRPRRILGKVFCILRAISTTHVDSRSVRAISVLIVCIVPNDIHNQIQLFRCMRVRDGDKVILFGDFLLVTTNHFFIDGVLNRSPFLEILV